MAFSETAGSLCGTVRLFCINKTSSICLCISISEIKLLAWLVLSKDSGSIKSWMEGMVYLLWPELHLCDPGRVDHGFGPAQVLYQALPLGWQAHKATVFGVKWGVNTVFKILGRWYLRPLLFLLAKHPQVHKGDSLPTSKCPCRKNVFSL